MEAELKMKVKSVSADLVSRKEAFAAAERAYREAENRATAELGKRGGEHALTLTLVAQGTARDRLAAVKTLVGESPETSVSLLKMLVKESKRPKEQLEGLRAFQELLLGPLRHCLEFAKPFAQAEPATAPQLAFFGNALYELFHLFCSLLEKAASGEPEFVATEAVKLAATTVAKLPDAFALPLVGLLIRRLPALKPIPANVAEKAVDVAISHRAGISYAAAAEVAGRIAAATSETVLLRLLGLLTAVKFSAVEDKRVIDLCLASFLAQIARVLQHFSGKRTSRRKFEAELQAQSRPAMQALAGLNKALPFVGNTASLLSFLDQHLPQLLTFVRRAPSRLAVQILLFFFHLLKSNLSSPRAGKYLALLLEYLKRPELYSSALLPLFLDLLLNVLKKDENLNRAKAFLKQLMQGVVHADSRVHVAALLLLSKLFEARPALAHLVPLAKDGEAAGPLQKREASDDESLQELQLSRRSYNPTIRKISGLILSGQHAEVNYKGNPFEDMTPVRLLRRFSLMPERQGPEKRVKAKPIVSLADAERLQGDNDAAIRTYFEQKAKSIAKRQRPRTRFGKRTWMRRKRTPSPTS